MSPFFRLEIIRSFFKLAASRRLTGQRVAADFQTAQPAIMLYARLLFASVLAWARSRPSLVFSESGALLVSELPASSTFATQSSDLRIARTTKTALAFDLKTPKMPQ
jgi:hypothetical protein